MYLKIQTIWTSKKIAVIILKLEQWSFYHTQMCPKDKDGMANSLDMADSVDHDQTDQGVLCWH